MASRLQDPHMRIARGRKKEMRDRVAVEKELDKEKLLSIFSPPLASELVLAIWSDTENFSQAAAMLKVLAAETADENQASLQPTSDTSDHYSHGQDSVGANDQQDVLTGHMKDLEIIDTPRMPGSFAHTNDDDRPLQTSAKTERKQASPRSTSPPPNDQKPIDFLKTCFPNVPETALQEAVSRYQNDISKCMDIILEKIAEQDEITEDSPDNPNDLAKIAVKDADAREQNDAVYLNGTKSSKQQRKKDQKIKKQVLWNAGGVHLPHNTAAPTDEGIIANPHKNQWQQFDTIIDRLCVRFPKVERPVITALVHKYNGDIHACVNELARQTTIDPAAYVDDWQSLKRFDGNLARLMSVFPDTPQHKLKNVLVAAELEADNKHWDDEQLLEHAITVQLQDTPDIPYFESPYSELDGQLLREARSTAGGPETVRLVPEYLLLDNLGSYVDDDPYDCRHRASELIHKRNKLYRKAAEAWQKARGKRSGQRGVAFYYSMEGRQYDEQIKELNMRAARAFVRESRIRSKDDCLLDLHGLTVHESMVVVKEGVTQWWSRSSLRGRSAARPLVIITGIGRHSPQHTSRIHPVVVKYLVREGWRINIQNRGQVVVTGLVR
ncbi:hypothetical protein BZG36_03787 [Bifiguratus adelaidae]|uniref:Smr domain-containing protein n=1 Tax=Bifiguratus adelaidae TaxID=1938954 RepID=A0A261XXJ0_9FUNG|nr:hypothetical protein BZG36_03787 [Bifiguratus adelaidae]